MAVVDVDRTKRSNTAEYRTAEAEALLLIRAAVHAASLASRSDRMEAWWRLGVAWQRLLELHIDVFDASADQWLGLGPVACHALAQRLTEIMAERYCAAGEFWIDARNGW